MEEGWRPEDIAALATGSRHPEQSERQKDGHSASWDTFWDTDQVFYGHVLGFKGLERALRRTRSQRQWQVRAITGTPLRRIIQGS
jgi:hypothetical protein